MRALEILCIVVVYFSSEEVLQGVSKNNPSKNQIDADIQVALEQRGENVAETIATTYKNELKITITCM